jgi:hypothetical protein
MPDWDFETSPSSLRAEETLLAHGFQALASRIYWDSWDYWDLSERSANIRLAPAKSERLFGAKGRAG